MLHTHITKGIILKRKFMPNGDLYLTSLTQEFGKIRIFAKGAYRITSRRSATIQSGNLVNLDLRKGADFWYLQNADLLSGFSQAKSNQGNLEHIYLILYIIDNLAPENEIETKLYNCLIEFFIKLSHVQIDVLNYVIKFLQILGYGTNEKSLDEVKRIVQEITGKKFPNFSIFK